MMNTMASMNTIITPSHKQRRYLELARRQAFQSDFTFKHGAILTKGGQIVNASYNKVFYSSFATRFQNRKNWRGTRHAEISCLLGLDFSLTHFGDLYVVRITNSGDLTLSAPCEMCCQLAKFTGIKRIIYSIDNERVGIIKL